MRNWFDVNKLTLNVEKCESISFGRAQPVSEEAFGEKISCKSSCKYLGVLTLSWPEKILSHPKIGCFNFKPQYLLNYTSPTNDLHSDRKRSIEAFKSIFKLLGLGPASTGSGLCAKPLHASCLCLLFSMFQNMLGPL